VIDWLASYPKSGNTWMRMLLANYFSETDEPHDINKPGVTNGIASSRWRFDELLGLDSAHLTNTEIMKLQPRAFEAMVAQHPAPQWMKVHDAQARLPGGEWQFPPHVSGSAIYIIRNPLDVAVSRAFHDGHGDMDKAVAMLCNPECSISGGGKNQLHQFMGDWSHHVLSWVDQDAIPVLVVRYEDMLADAGRELTRVIRAARPEEVIDPGRIVIAVQNAAFETLQAKEAEHGFRETTARQNRFFRNGTAGDWVNHLTDAQEARIRDAQGAVMKRFGYALAQSTTDIELG
jgi:aryl sulfotransferase